MSFLSHIGLSVVDKLTGNALDKLGNAIKDGDVTELVKQFTGILEGVEDRLGDVSDLFEDFTDDAKKDIRREIARVKRRLLREARVELEELYEDFGDKMVEAMKPQIAELVEAEVARQGGEVEETLEFDASSRVLTLSRSGGGDLVEFSRTLVADLSPLADGKE